MQDQHEQYVICIRNVDDPASLEIRKIYPVIPDAEASAHGMVRLVDESGVDYLYPADMLLPTTLPDEVSRALAS